MLVMLSAAVLAGEAKAPDAAAPAAGDASEALEVPVDAAPPTQRELLEEAVALRRMAERNVNQLPVVADGRLLGAVTRERLIALVQAQLALGART